ncbi:hypothetical protein VUR80DRAFT_7821 [Thermomyces stellatus]
MLPAPSASGSSRTPSCRQRWIRLEHNSHITRIWSAFAHLDGNTTTGYAHNRYCYFCGSCSVPREYRCPIQCIRSSTGCSGSRPGRAGPDQVLPSYTFGHFVARFQCCPTTTRITLLLQDTINPRSHFVYHLNLESLKSSLSILDLPSLGLVSPVLSLSNAGLLGE